MLAKDYGLSTAGLAIAWLIAKDEHIGPILVLDLLFI